MNEQRFRSLLPALAVFAFTFLGWLALRRPADIGASLSRNDEVYRCDCVCGNARATLEEYGTTLEPEEAGACLRVNGVRCGADDQDDPVRYSNCAIGGKSVPGGVVRPD